jgi:hypothetical protein
LSFFLATGDDWDDFFDFWDYEPEDAIWNPDDSCDHTYSDGGGHGLLCVGYNDDDPDNAYWIMVNSWGTTSGRPNGIFHLDMDMDYSCIFYFYVDPNWYYDFSFTWQTLDITYNVWESYSGNYYDSGGTQNDYFDDPGTEHEVYMYGTGFTDGEYRVIFWDHDGDKALTETESAVSGVLTVSHTFNESQDAAGDWHVTVYSPSSYDPSSYSASDSNIVADDTSYNGTHAFHVEATAIPEFPTAIIAIAVLAICSGIYFWLRRKAAPVSV